MRCFVRPLCLVALASATLIGCGSSDPEIDVGPDFTRSDLRLKGLFSVDDPQPFGKIVFTWDEVEGATSYKLFEDRDGDSDGDGEPEFVQVGADIPPDTLEASTDISVHLFDWANARFMLESCVDAECTEVGRQGVNRLSPAYIRVLANAGANVAYAEDGQTLAVGSPGTSAFVCDEIFPVPAEEVFDAPCQYDENLTPEEIDALVLTETIQQAGAVVIFALVDDVWTVQTTLKASNIEPGDVFGSAVAISDDGNTLAVSALGEDSAATGVDGDEADNEAVDSGAVYVFDRTLNGDEFEWTQRTYIKPSNTEGDPDVDNLIAEGDRFGNRLALSGDGLTLVVAAWGEDSNSLLIDVGDDNNDAQEAGAAYVFRDTGGTWAQEAYLKASNTTENDLFGSALAISVDGNRIAVGALNESSDSAADPFSEAAENSGAVYIFERSGSTWMEQAIVKPDVIGVRDEFGTSVALNGAGNRLAVGAPQEDSGATAVGGSTTDNSAENTGAAYLFELSGSTWTQIEFFKADNADPVDELGFAVKLNRTGDKLLATAVREGSNAVGINGQGELDFAVDSGAGYLFVETAEGWEQLSYIKAASTGSQTLFGWDAGFALDGERLAISAFNLSTVFVH